MDRRNFERYLDVKEDSDGFRYYDLNKSPYFPEETIEALSQRYVYRGEPWTQLSYNAYGTMHLYWLILAFNNIENPFEKVESGTELRIPRNDVVRSIIDKIRITS